jgi:hypothetical protein
MAFVTRELTQADRASFEERVFALEKGVTYPLGDDFFEIDHGDDYFAFFDRLGETAYHVVLDEDRVVAVGCGVLRAIPKGFGGPPEKIWYGCDLKVHRDYRRRRLPWEMFKYAFPRKYPSCGRGYGISMNPGDGSENPVVRMCERFSLAPMRLGATLFFYSLNAREMQEVAPLLGAERGALSYLSLGGIKDIVLQSTSAPMPLLHVQFGPCAERNPSPRRGRRFDAPQPANVHMFCTPVEDDLARAMHDRGYLPSATASVVQHRMGAWDWRFVLTSEI